MSSPGLDRHRRFNDAAVGAYLGANGSASRGEVLDAIDSKAGFWGDAALSVIDQIASPAQTPAITYSANQNTALSSPVEYRPVVCGTGTQVTNWDGQNDPAMVFHPGRFETNNGGRGDLALAGAVKPGGASQAARWPMIVEFVTSSGTDRVEVSFFGSSDISFALEVNGLRSSSPYTIDGPPGLGNGKKMLLTFPDARSRRIRLYLNGGAGFHAVRVPTGQSISKPSDGTRVGVVIGDSFANGSGSVNQYPAGAGIFDTYALRTLKSLGCNRFILAGIGGSGFVNGGSTSAYYTRVSTVLGLTPAPNVLVINGSINDNSTGSGVAAAVTSFLSDVAAIPEKYVVGTMKSGFEGGHDAVAAGAEAAGVPFVSMRGFLSGTGRITAPNGTGNADFLILGDGSHPTLPGHVAVSSRIITQLARLRGV